MDERPDQPVGFVWIGAFFVFGAIMSAYAALTLLRPGTAADALWKLNQKGHAGLLPLRNAAVLLFVVLFALLTLAAIGWFRRRRWGWVLGVAIVAMNLAGDAVSLFIGRELKGVAGMVIAGALLVYMSRASVRNYFSR